MRIFEVSPTAKIEIKYPIKTKPVKIKKPRLPEIIKVKRSTESAKDA